MNFIHQFYRLVHPQRRLLALSIGCGLLFVAANLLPPLAIRRLIQWLTEGGGSPAGLLQLALMLLVTYLVRGLVRYGYGLYSHMAAYQVMHRLMVRVYRHLQHMPHRFFHQRRTGDLMARSINDVEAVEDFIAHGIPETFLALVIPGAMLTVLFILDVRLALIALLPIPWPLSSSSATSPGCAACGPGCAAAWANWWPRCRTISRALPSSNPSSRKSAAPIKLKTAAAPSATA